jgi:hypothetical protein
MCVVDSSPSHERRTDSARSSQLMFFRWRQIEPNRKPIFVCEPERWRVDSRSDIRCKRQQRPVQLVCSLNTLHSCVAQRVVCFVDKIYHDHQWRQWQQPSTGSQGWHGPSQAGFGANAQGWSDCTLSSSSLLLLQIACCCSCLQVHSCFDELCESANVHHYYYHHHHRWAD